MERPRKPVNEIIDKIGESGRSILAVLMPEEPLPRIGIIERMQEVRGDETESRPDSKVVHRILRTMRQHGLVHDEPGFPVRVPGSRGQTIPTQRRAYSLTLSGLEVKKHIVSRE